MDNQENLPIYWSTQHRYNYWGVDEYERGGKGKSGPVYTSRVKKDAEQVCMHLNRAFAMGMEAQRVEDAKKDNPDFYTITEDDVGKRVIDCWGKKWLTMDFMGVMLSRDVGKRVYRVQGDGIDILQVENDHQYQKRMNQS